MNQLIEVARQWQQLWFPLFQGLEQLRNEVPATAEVLAPKHMGFALRWKLTMDGVLEVLSQLAQHPDIKAFFARHPELTEVVEAGGSFSVHASTWQEGVSSQEGGGCRGVSLPPPTPLPTRA